MVDRVGNAPTTSRMSSEHSTFELTVLFEITLGHLNNSLLTH